MFKRILSIAKRRIQPDASHNIMPVMWLASVLSLLIIHSYSFAQSTEISVIKISEDGWSKQLLAYQQDLYRAAFKEGKEKFGDYKLVFSNRKLSSKRTLAEIERGSIHTSFGSGLGTNPDGYPSDVDQLRYPYLKSLGGLRRCITHKENLPKLEGIKTLEDLKRVRLGQGANWPEVEIYEANGVNVAKGKTIDVLLMMLAKKRFDCLPLSVLEIDREYDKALAKNPDFVIAPTFHIFYPNPIYINITRTDKQLADRLEFGVDTVFKNGKSDEIFDKHFGNGNKPFLPENAKLIIFDNQLIDAEINKSIIEYFREEHIANRQLSVEAY